MDKLRFETMIGRDAKTLRNDMNETADNTALKEMVHTIQSISGWIASAQQEFTRDQLMNKNVEVITDSKNVCTRRKCHTDLPKLFWDNTVGVEPLL